LFQINRYRIRRLPGLFQAGSDKVRVLLSGKVFSPRACIENHHSRSSQSAGRPGAGACCGIAPQSGLTSGTGSPSPTVGRASRNYAFRKRLKRRWYFFATESSGRPITA
jgi:hypothetical protein